MNEKSMNNSSIDPELQVRLMNLVMGEASDFERDQLQCLMEQRSDLAAYFRHIQHLHGLLCEVGIGEPTFDTRSTKEEMTWQLSPERRNVLLSVLDGTKENPFTQTDLVESPKTNRNALWSLRWMGALAATAASLVIGLILFSRNGSKTASFAFRSKSSETRSFDFKANPATSGTALYPYMANDNVQYAPSRDSDTRTLSESAPTVVPMAVAPLNDTSKAQYDVENGRIGAQTNLPSSAKKFEEGYVLPNNTSSGRFDQAYKNESVANGPMLGKALGGFGGGAVRGDASNAMGSLMGVEAFDGHRKLAEGAGKNPRTVEDLHSFDVSTPETDGSVLLGEIKSKYVAPESRRWSGGNADQGLTELRETALPRLIVPEEEDYVLGFDTGNVTKNPTGTLWKENSGSNEYFHDRWAVESSVSENRPEAVPALAASEPVSQFDTLQSKTHFEERERSLRFGTSTVEEMRLSIPGSEQSASRGTTEQLEELVADKELNDKSKSWSKDTHWGDAQPLSSAGGESKGFDAIRAKRHVSPPSLELGQTYRFRTENDFEKPGEETDVKAATSKPADSPMTGAKTANPTSPELSAKLKILKNQSAIDEQSAVKEPFSTFSLHVSDVSFKLAQTALSQGQWPDATKVRIEEFVNALDYRDPLPCGDEKVACRVEQAIHPFLIQRNLLRVSMRTAAVGRSQNTPLRLTLLLDNSGSMERPDRRQAVLQAFQSLITQLKESDQITLISFASAPRLLADKVSATQAEMLIPLIENLPSEGGTNIESALTLAREKASEQFLPSAQNRIVMLTDGAVNLGNADPDTLAKKITEMRDQGIAFDAAGIVAQDLNDEVLEALTRQGDGRYYLLDSAESVGENFASQIAGSLHPSAQNVKVQVEFNPQRVGRYKLLGYEKHRLNKEDFRNDKVDAAEMAAAEAGVAVYHYEIKPNGIGDVGSVSVRFRDVASGNMVEHRWPIPYEPGSPQIEQAPPSMQLAASASLLAAKLQGGPLSDSIDLSRLKNLLSSLPEKTANQLRVQQLRTMVEQASAIAK